MTDLKTITRDIHTAAEETEFSKMLITGDLSRDEYATFLANQLEAYQAIERRGLITMPALLRVPNIIADINELSPDSKPRVVDATWRYVNYIAKLPDDLVWAHIYVRYLGDLFGGQMIKKSITWPTTSLDFNDRLACIAYLREHTATADPSEAVAAFKWVIDIYEEMHAALRKTS